jgi:hypothetical protein
MREGLALPQSSSGRSMEMIHHGTTSGFLVLVLVAGFLGAVTGCGGGGGGSGGDEATLRVLATDAPFPYDSVVKALVEVQSIEIRPVGAPFETLITFPGGRELDLTLLRNGAVDVLYEGNPGPGDYDAIRIVVVAKEIVVLDDGTERSFTDFEVPSGEQTGVKVFVDPVLSVTGGLTRDLVLDMDLANSFVVQGNPATPAGIKGFHFKPVVRAVNASTAGSLTFRVMSDNGTPSDTGDDFYLDGAAYALADASGAVVATGASGTDPADPAVEGYVYHPAIPAGMYDLEVGFRSHDTELRTITIQVANLTDLGVVLLASSGEVIEGTVTTRLSPISGDDLVFPVAGATAEAYPVGQATAAASDTTNGLGFYSLSPGGPGTYDVKVTKAGYEDAQDQAGSWIAGTPGASLDFELIPRTANVSGTVTDAGSQPVTGATVTAQVAYEGSWVVIQTDTTDTNGAYTLADLPTGDFLIEVTVGNATASREISHEGGTSISGVDLQLP